MPTILFADTETYYDGEYSLRKMKTAQYIRDERFKVHGWAFAVGDGDVHWLSHEKTKKFLSVLDPNDTILVGHNLMFDGAILAWLYGFKPLLYVDTMGMSRAIIGRKSASHSLDTVAKFIGRPGKVKAGALNDVKGVRDLTREQFLTLGEYAKDDVSDTRAIFKYLRKSFPKPKYKTLDWTIRMFTEPLLRINRSVMEAEHGKELERKQEMLDALGLERRQINSNEQFAGLLRDAGVEPPMKISKSTGKDTYAFAKTDAGMEELLQHEDPYVQQLAEARITVKSSIVETRAKALADVADFPFSVPLSFSGAMQTHRLSAADYNMQNLPKFSDIRNGIEAPEGYVIIVADSSNIELRVNCKATGQTDAIDAVRKGHDLYCKFGVPVFGHFLDKKTESDERFICKVGVLSLGYGASSPVFRNMVRVQSKQYLGKIILLPEDMCDGIVRAYRQEEYPMVAAAWQWLNGALDAMMMGCKPRNLVGDPPIEWATDGFFLPSGLKVQYNDLRFVEGKNGKRQRVFTARSRNNPEGTKTIWGAGVLENVSQSLTSEIIDEKVQLIRENVAPVVLQVHDEVVTVVPERDAESAAKAMGEIMNLPVSFWPDLPLGSEVGIGKSYGEAK